MESLQRCPQNNRKSEFKGLGIKDYSKSEFKGLSIKDYSIALRWKVGRFSQQVGPTNIGFRITSALHSLYWCSIIRTGV